MLRRAVMWTFSGQIASFVLSFGGSVIVARFLSPHELGIYAVAAATLGILQIISAFGVGAYVVREAELEVEVLDAAFTINALLSLALAAVILLASHPAAVFLQEPAVASVLQLLALTPVLGILEFRPAAMLQREMEFKVVSLVSTARTAGGIIATVAGAAAGAGYMSPAYGSVASAVIGLVGFLVFGRRHFGLGLSLTGWRAMTVFGLQMMSVGGVAVAAVRLSDIIMGRLLGLSALGLYSRATNLSNLIFTNIYGTATRVVFAQLAKDFRERGVARDTFLRGLRIIAGVMGPIQLGVAILARPLIATLYGDKWLGAAPALSLLMVAQFISLAFAMNWELFVVRDELKLQTKFEIMRSVFGVLSQTVGCAFGLVGAAASSVVDALFSVGLYQRHMSRLADTSQSELVRIYAEAALLSVVTVLPSAALMWWTGWSAATSPWVAAIAVALGGGMWLALLMRTGHPLWEEMRFIAGKLRRTQAPAA